MIFGYDPDDTRNDVDLEWIRRCHAVKVKELETRIQVLEEENKEWEEFCAELEAKPWYKAYRKLHDAVHKARADLREAMSE